MSQKINRLTINEDQDKTPTTRNRSAVVRNAATHHDAESPLAETQLSIQSPETTPLLGWQRQFGNQGTVQRLHQLGLKGGKKGSAGRVQRFEGREHRKLGDAAGRDFPAGALFEGSPPLSYGELVALSGDFYGSFDHLADPHYVALDAKKMETPGELPESLDMGKDPKSEAASKAKKIDELTKLKHLLVLEQQAADNPNKEAGEDFLKKLDTEYVQDGGQLIQGYDQLTGGRYGKLALTNFRHFSVGAKGMTNVDTWQAEHGRALQEAWQAGLENNEGKFNKAMMRNAASNHYLTDAFSSGHMRTPRQQIDRYYRNMIQGLADQLPSYLVSGIPDNYSFDIPLSSLSKYLPDGLPTLPDVSVKIEFSLVEMLKAKMAGLGTELGAKLRPQLYGFIGVAVGGLVSKWLHDADNEHGLMVASKAHPAPWRAFGDDYMEKDDPGAKINEAEAMKAVKEDAAEIQRMYEMGLAASSQQPGNQKPQKKQKESVPPAKAVYFGFDKPKGNADANGIAPTDVPGLNSLATYLKSTNGVTVTLQGWADSRGAAGYNTQLSLRRINAVRAYLLQQGVASSKIGTPQPMGEPPVATTNANHHLYRRVDIVLSGAPTKADPDQQADQSQEGSAAIPKMPEITEFAASKYIPQMMGNQDNPLPNWKWPEIQDQALKQQVTEKAKSMVRGVVGGMLEKQIQDNLPETYKTKVHVPIVGDVEIAVPLQPFAHGIKDKIVSKTLGLLDEHFAQAMDAAAAVGGGEAEAADQQPLAP